VNEHKKHVLYLCFGWNAHTITFLLLMGIHSTFLTLITVTLSFLIFVVNDLTPLYPHPTFVLVSAVGPNICHHVTTCLTCHRLSTLALKRLTIVTSIPSLSGTVTTS
jgi:hypothetical protein